MYKLNFRNKGTRIALHVMFWCLSFYILLQAFSYGNKPATVDFIYCSLFHLFLVPPVYFNLYFLLPKTGNKISWFLYPVILVTLISLFAWLNVGFFNNWSATLFPDYYFISFYSWKEIAGIIFIYVAITTLLTLSKSWFAVNELQKQLLQAEKEKIHLELASLKSQINPHFFFNTLNGIYAMSFKNNPDLAAAVIRLSDLMRYFIYDSAAERVPLEKEIKVLDDYQSLMRLRADKTADIRMKVTGDPEGRSIAPLLLISFLENAFKHGIKGARENTFVDLVIEISPNLIKFSLSNNKGKADESDVREQGGIGLENVKRRLELLYPAKYTLDVIENDETYRIDLNLKT
ncbi:sensor histidine kinase [Pollutibacter soli]|uniref:sensor histidine kinase n=1 Tax=Pollutibacter soli TaxID=3034157 RepID=UPI003013FA3B